MDFRRKAIELYKQGKSMDEISRNIGFNVEENIVKNWVNEDKARELKIVIFKLDKKQRQEKDYNKRKELVLDLKERLEKVLEIVPYDVDMKTKLMYAYINLGEIENAKNLGNEILKSTQSKELLNGLSIIEEKSGNYDKAIEYIEKILEDEPNNEFLKKKIERIEAKKQNNKSYTEKEILYREIASLERSIRYKIEKHQERAIRNDEDANKDEIIKKAYIETYEKVKDLATNILIKYPKEIIAREKLVKSLFITGRKNEAEQEIEELLNFNENDEIGLWYLSKIQREKGDLKKEKDCLERILANSPEGSQIKVQQRLERLNNIIEQQEEKKQIEEGLKENYTEETRKEFIEKIQKDFIYGKITKANIDDVIEEARKYPNFNKSLVELLEIKSKITGNRQDKIDELDKYIEEEYSITPEEYSNVLDEITQTREQIEDDKKIEKYLDNKEKQEKRRGSKEQREYSKMIIEKLNKGEITKENLPEIVAKLETLEDRTRSIFLITKLYEIVYDREKAYNELVKYTHISNLSDKEKERIANMQRVLTSNEKTKGATHRIKKLYSKQTQKHNKFTKKINKEEIIKLLEDRKSVKQILGALKENGVSLKSIARVKSFYLRENEELRKEDLRLERYAKNLIKEGYKIQDVYDIMEYDIPLPRLQKIALEIKQQNRMEETR